MFSYIAICFGLLRFYNRAQQAEAEAIDSMMMLMMMWLTMMIVVCVALESGVVEKTQINIEIIRNTLKLRGMWRRRGGEGCVQRWRTIVVTLIKNRL